MEVQLHILKRLLYVDDGKFARESPELFHQITDFAPEFRLSVTVRKSR